jgi:hypothetical protein
MKIPKVALLVLQKLPNFVKGYINSEGTTFLIGQSSNPLRISSYNIWKLFKLKSSLNFKGVQTFLGKYDKLSKIPSSHDILECEFRLTHLYSNIGSSFTSGNGDFVQIISKIAGHFRILCPIL